MQHHVWVTPTMCWWQIVAARDQRHQGSGPDASHSGEVCAGRSSEERSQRERRQTLDPQTLPSRPRHVRVELQAHRVRTHCHTGPWRQQRHRTRLLFVCFFKHKLGSWKRELWMHKSKITLASWTECVSSLCSLQPWDAERCLVQFEKDGVIQTQEKSQRQHNGLSYSHSWTSQQKVSLTGHSNTDMVVEYPLSPICEEKLFYAITDWIWWWISSWSVIAWWPQMRKSDNI